MAVNKILKNITGYRKEQIAKYGAKISPGEVVQKLPPVDTVIRLYQTIYSDREKMSFGSYGKEHLLPATGCITEGGRERYWQVIGYTKGMENPCQANNHMLVRCINPEIIHKITQSYPVIQISYGILRIKIDGYVADDGTVCVEDKEFYKYM